MFEVDQLTADRQVSHAQLVVDEVVGAAQGFFQVVKMAWQFVVQGALHGRLIARLLHGRLQDAVAEDGKGGQGCEFVVGVFFQPVDPGTLLWRAAIEWRQVGVFLFQVVADHAGVGQGEVAVLQCRNPPQRAELAVPLGLAEGRDDFQLIIQPLLSEKQAQLAYEG